MSKNSKQPNKIKIPLKILQRADLIRLFPRQGGSIDEMLILEDLTDRLKLTDDYKSKISYQQFDEFGNLTTDPKKAFRDDWNDDADDFCLEVTVQEFDVIKKCCELAIKKEAFPRSLARWYSKN